MKNKSTSPYDGMLVSELLSQREKLKELSLKQQQENQTGGTPGGQVCFDNTITAKQEPNQDQDDNSPENVNIKVPDMTEKYRETSNQALPLSRPIKQEKSDIYRACSSAGQSQQGVPENIVPDKAAGEKKPQKTQHREKPPDNGKSLNRKEELKQMAQKFQERFAAMLRKPDRRIGCTISSLSTQQGSDFTGQKGSNMQTDQEMQIMMNQQHHHQHQQQQQNFPVEMYQSQQFPHQQVGGSMLTSPIMQRLSNTHNMTLALQGDEPPNQQMGYMLPGHAGTRGQPSPGNDYVNTNVVMTGLPHQHQPGKAQQMYHGMQGALIGRHPNMQAAMMNQQFSPGAGPMHSPGAVPGMMQAPDINLQIPGLPTMDSWAEMQKLNRKKTTTKKGKRKYNHILDRSSPCPNVDVRHIQQDVKSGGGGGMPSFPENATSYLAHQSALVASSIGKTGHVEGCTQSADDNSSIVGSGSRLQVSPALSASSLSTKSSTPTGKSTPISSPSHSSSQTSPASSSSRSTPKNSFVTTPSSGGTLTNATTTTSMPSPLQNTSVNQQKTVGSGYTSPTPPGDKGLQAHCSGQSPRTVQQIELQKQLNVVTGGHPSLSSRMNMVDPITLALSASLSPNSGTPRLPASGTSGAQSLRETQSPGGERPQITSLNLHTVLNPRGTPNFPASTLLSAAARAQGSCQHSTVTMQSSPDPSSSSTSSANQSGAQFAGFAIPSSGHTRVMAESQNQRSIPPAAVMNNLPVAMQMSMMGGGNSNAAQMLLHQMTAGAGINVNVSPGAVVVPPAEAQAFTANMTQQFMNMAAGGQVQQQRIRSQHRKEQTPIQMVQNMISGLEATQNAIAAAHAAANAPASNGTRSDGTWSSKRRKSSSSESSTSARQSVSRGSEVGSAVDSAPGLDKGTPDSLHNAAIVNSHPGDIMMTHSSLYGNMALTHSVDGTMDPNGPASGAVFNANAVPGSATSLNGAILPMVNMNVTSTVPPLSIAAATTGTNRVTQMIPAVTLSQLAAPNMMQVLNALGGTTTLQNPVLISNNLNIDSLQRVLQMQEVAGLANPAGQKLNINTLQLTDILKQQNLLVQQQGLSAQQQLDNPSGLQDEAIIRCGEEPHVTCQLGSEVTHLVPHNQQSGTPDYNQEQRLAETTEGSIDCKDESKDTFSNPGDNYPSDVGDHACQQDDSSSAMVSPQQHLHVNTEHSVMVSSGQQGLLSSQTSPRTTRGTREPKLKRKRERSRKSSTPTIANMLQAAQMSPQASNAPVVMVPSMQAPLLQVVNPAVNHFTAGHEALNAQQMMYFPLAAAQNLNTQVFPQNQGVGFTVSTPQGEISCVQGTQVSPGQDQSAMNFAQNQLNVLQTMNLLPPVGNIASLNPALLQMLQSVPSTQNLGGVTNLTGLQPQIQQQLLRQMAPLSVQSQNLLQLLQQNVTTLPEAGTEVSSVEEQVQTQLPPQERSLSEPTERDSFSVVPSENSRDSSLSASGSETLKSTGDALTPQSTEREGNVDAIYKAVVSAATCGVKVVITDEECSASVSTTSSRSPPGSIMSSVASSSTRSSPYHSKRSSSSSSSIIDTNPDSPGDCIGLTPSIPNPANLTEAVTAVVRSQDVFGEEDDTPRIGPPLRKYTVRRTRNPRRLNLSPRHLSKHALTDINNSPTSPIVAANFSSARLPATKSPVARTLTFETPPKSPVATSSTQESPTLSDAPDSIPNVNCVSMNSIGTNTDDDGLRDASLEQEEEQDVDQEEEAIGTKMASTATMTDDEHLTEGDREQMENAEHLSDDEHMVDGDSENDMEPVRDEDHYTGEMEEEQDFVENLGTSNYMNPDCTESPDDTCMNGASTDTTYQDIEADSESGDLCANLETTMEDINEMGVNEMVDSSCSPRGEGGATSPTDQQLLGDEEDTNTSPECGDEVVDTQPGTELADTEALEEFEDVEHEGNELEGRPPFGISLLL